MGRIFQIFLSVLLVANVAFAADELKSVRWTERDTEESDLARLLPALNAKLGLNLTLADFLQFENRDLATSQFKMVIQVYQSIAVDGASLRVWSDRANRKLIQFEAFVQDPLVLESHAQSLRLQGFTMSVLKGVSRANKAWNTAQNFIQKRTDDRLIRGVTSKDVWRGADVVRVFTVKAKRGTHTIIYSLSQQALLKASYDEYPQADHAVASATEFAVPALVYPVYEEDDSSGTILTRVPAQLKYLKVRARRTNEDPFESLRQTHFFENKYHPVLGETDAGRQQGFWAGSYVKRLAQGLFDAIPLSDNTFSTGGVLLEGRYATVSIHPSATEAFRLGGVPVAMGGHYVPHWKTVTVGGQEQWELIPSASLLGKPLLSFQEAVNRTARRLPDHNFVQYAKDGFDEVQVYYSITSFMESLQSMGFLDPDLSTRPFNAILYDPDISMQDNAYYTDDTINFTTYTSKTGNMARDNTTIWHELGHGVMDRLMGDVVSLAGAGGLSEGNADFAADLVLNDVWGAGVFPGRQNMRVLNKTGFSLTNEVHDDGEAFGGAMHDLLERAIARWGSQGVRKVGDLFHEAQRLSRNHPRLTAADWFDRVLFADERGTAGVRAPGELRNLVTEVLLQRNYSADGTGLANYSMVYDGHEVNSSAIGSRGRPVLVSLHETDVSPDFVLDLSLTDGQTMKFKYPVTVKVAYNGGPLQGAIHWVGEEAGAQEFTFASPQQANRLVSLKVTGKCDYVNREDGSCVDFVYAQIFNAGETKPVAKKRFYLRVKAL